MRAGKAALGEIGAAARAQICKISPFHDDAPGFGAGEVRRRENGFGEICGRGACRRKLTSRQRRIGKPGAVEHCFGEIGSGPDGVGEIGAGQIETGEDSAVEMGPVETGVTYICFAEIGAAEIGPSEVGDRQVAIA